MWGGRTAVVAAVAGGVSLLSLAAVPRWWTPPRRVAPSAARLWTPGRAAGEREGERERGGGGGVEKDGRCVRKGEGCREPVRGQGSQEAGSSETEEAEIKPTGEVKEAAMASSG